jgi:hypothetical protein
MVVAELRRGKTSKPDGKFSRTVGVIIKQALA